LKFVFIRTEKALYPVVVLCRVLEVSCSGFYAWLKRAVALHAKVDAQLVVELRLAHQRSRETYGRPLLQ
jgi:putative transposase